MKLSAHPDLLNSISNGPISSRGINQLVRSQLLENDNKKTRAASAFYCCTGKDDGYR